ncbi:MULTISPECIES: acetyl-CoA carboxylase biotin carboxylase subunit [Corynebacterium]|uniref:biotin carboxylase n=1 Tax=Corynebacterium provencense TaxID=1737425 RepID=A0A2Z3Z1B8_9CORY|nr:MULTISPECIES: acetyl-CoA carboxylase biotin carboxylase subunit [Corynebacterium]AWT27393.1 Biotin carboxylase [Corynebacterium provencense]MCI1255739.1 acetyl-CoA carboxylase biotin carboxylase subunit [Corynebacterium provencense]
MRKLLVANRGEIAARIIRSARDAGIRTVLTVSEPDRDSVAATMADETVVIGPAPVTGSYLNIDAVLDAVRSSGADAVHPGFGFLSENADFARAVLDAGVTWVGPSPETIELMGNKSAAREAAEAAGVPTLPGTRGALDPGADAETTAAGIGYPLVVKASAGGGGRGIRLVEKPGELLSTIELARAEARAAFGDPSVYLERFIENARHVEVQILADDTRVIHLGDRDCSMQRRHQKLLEEAPAPALPDHVRETIRSSSVELARNCGYRGAGTVEFLYDPVRQEASFIEMNTRIQVEHPVTEMITGVDIVAEQLRVADGLPLSVSQGDIVFDGHAFEARINAEDPANSFMPSPGTLTTVIWPTTGEVRVDTGFEEGSAVLPFYDSMIAKIIVHAATRDLALEALRTALDELHIEGVATTRPLLAALAATPELREVRHHSTFVEHSGELYTAHHGESLPGAHHQKGLS